MSRRQLYQDLAAVRALVADGRDRLHESVGDLDQFWLNSARRRLESVDKFLIAAAGGLNGWARTAIGAAAMLVAAAATAVLAGALGFPAFWVVACSWVVAVLVELPVRRRVARLAPAVGRRRLDRAAAPRRTRELASLPEALVRARVRLVSTALRQAGSKHWRAAYLARAAADDPTMFWLSEADLLLCQAIDYLEQYLAADDKEPT
jgi:hypothetical protein